MAAIGKQRLVRQMEESRKRTLAMLEPLDDPVLTASHSELMAPLVWDLAHVGYFEELWISRRIDGRPPLIAEHDDIYDAFRHSRADRAELPLLDPVRARRYLKAVRELTLATLETIDLDRRDPLLADGYIFGLVLQHEQQHRETMLQTLQLWGGKYPPAADPEMLLPPEAAAASVTDAAAAVGPAAETLVEGGEFLLGDDGAAWAYDNERPHHVVTVAPFRIDTAPVTNRAYAAFIGDGGYRRESLWSPAGLEWLAGAGSGTDAPLGWQPEGDGDWSRLRFGHVETLPADEPVQHVNFHEAEAFARWAGRRLPTEIEWEYAASNGSRKTSWPWGEEGPARSRANLGAGSYRPAPVGSLPKGASRSGLVHLLGDVWEWTSSRFTGYPGFEAFPYREYSEVFFDGDYRVLRGGSWATEPGAIRTTFRNWDVPARRQIFAGFRCARDA